MHLSNRLGQENSGVQKHYHVLKGTPFTSFLVLTATPVILLGCPNDKLPPCLLWTSGHSFFLFHLEAEFPQNLAASRDTSSGAPSGEKTFLESRPGRFYYRVRRDEMLLAAPLAGSRRASREPIDLR